MGRGAGLPSAASAEEGPIRPIASGSAQAQDEFSSSSSFSSSFSIGLRAFSATSRDHFRRPSAAPPRLPATFRNIPRDSATFRDIN